MTVFNTVKGTLSTAVDAISSVTQSLVEKNRTNAKLNRLRLIMKNESELMNRAYIALGKQYFEAKSKGEEPSVEKQAKLFEVIEKSKAKIAKARDCYRQIVDSQNDIFYGTPEKEKEYSSEDVVDITVACSNENEYDSSPFETAVQEALFPEAEAEIETEASVQTAVQDDLAEDAESPESELF